MKTIISGILLTAALGVAMADEPRKEDTDIDAMHADFSTLAGGSYEPAAYSSFTPVAAEGYRYENLVTGSSPFRRMRRGILVVGDGDTIRAMEPFKTTDGAERRYASVVNEYARRLGDSVRVYCMPVPTAVAFYCPDGARGYTSASRPAMEKIFAGLDESVVPVDIFPTLGTHAAEPIYSRTDHHWAPLGAYYAAACFASDADVPFASLESYAEQCVEGYVGTMKKFSADPRVGQAPETFTYYTPLDSCYEVTYRIYSLDKTRRNVTSRTEPRNGKLFQNFTGSATYLTFLGGDSRLTEISTNVGNGRRLLILKDSFGNAIPGYLTGSFDKIHVVDCRYFTDNIISYMKRNGITDVLFVNNLTHAVNPRTTETYLRYLEQEDICTEATTSETGSES